MFRLTDDLDGCRQTGTHPGLRPEQRNWDGPAFLHLPDRLTGSESSLEPSQLCIQSAPETGSDQARFVECS